MRILLNVVYPRINNYTFNPESVKIVYQKQRFSGHELLVSWM